MHNYCINKLLNLREVKVKNIIHADSFVKIFMETKAKAHTCSFCGAITDSKCLTPLCKYFD